MKTKTLRQYIKELEKISNEFGDNLPVLLKFIPPHLPYKAIYRDLKVKIERAKIICIK